MKLFYKQVSVLWHQRFLFYLLKFKYHRKVGVDRICQQHKQYVGIQTRSEKISPQQWNWGKTTEKRPWCATSKTVQPARGTKISECIWTFSSLGSMSKIMFLPFSSTDCGIGPKATQPSCDPGKAHKVNKVGHRVQLDGRHWRVRGWQFCRQHVNNAPARCQVCSGGKCHIARNVSTSNWGPVCLKS